MKRVEQYANLSKGDVARLKALRDRLIILEVLEKRLQAVVLLWEREYLHQIFVLEVDELEELKAPLKYPECATPARGLTENLS